MAEVSHKSNIELRKSNYNFGWKKTTHTKSVLVPSQCTNVLVINEMKGNFAQLGFFFFNWGWEEEFLIQEHLKDHVRVASSLQVKPRRPSCTSRVLPSLRLSPGVELEGR